MNMDYINNFVPIRRSGNYESKWAAFISLSIWHEKPFLGDHNGRAVISAT